MKLQPPLMHSLIKLHIPEYPIRSEVSYVSAHIIKTISRVLFDIIIGTCNLEAHHSVNFRTNLCKISRKSKSRKMPNSDHLMYRTMFQAFLLSIQLYWFQIFFQIFGPGNLFESKPISLQ